MKFPATPSLKSVFLRKPKVISLPVLHSPEYPAPPPEVMLGWDHHILPATPLSWAFEQPPRYCSCSNISRYGFPQCLCYLKAPVLFAEVYKEMIKACESHSKVKALWSPGCFWGFCELGQASRWAEMRERAAPCLGARLCSLHAPGCPKRNGDAPCLTRAPARGVLGEVACKGKSQGCIFPGAYSR